MPAGRQPVAAVQVGLVDLYMDYTVAVAGTGIQPGEAHDRRDDIVPAGRYDTARMMAEEMPPEHHEKGDRTEGWQMLGSSPHSLRGRDLAFR